LSDGGVGRGDLRRKSFAEQIDPDLGVVDSFVLIDDLAINAIDGVRKKPRAARID